ncbi:hypothetical protein QA639_09460 [Bradyrhizobium pachyrhizi]|uniref:hypothetical protein n=1 Tax=Bradyrhizobium pachyrhizi TaxID=280333 RepID=UPI0003FD4018|nr:hypothetical protein [Bradyrhizobium pachyrhizi]WFU57713.1 hypothetical protein QA639_09460 [Bradyrhizobium pachyrhizi]
MPLPVPPYATGGPDLESAKAAFRTAWERFYSGLSPKSIEHWHQNQDAAKERFGRNKDR